MSCLYELRGTVGNFTSSDILKSSGIKERQISCRTIRRSLQILGYSYDQCRQKRPISWRWFKTSFNVCSKMLKSGLGGISFIYMEQAGYIKLNPWKVFVLTDHERGKRKVKVWKDIAQVKEKKWCWSTNGSLHGSYCTQ